MTARYESIRTELQHRPRRWLVTGAGGFIGSHLVETLLRLDQSVTGLDNLATGSRSNLEQVRAAVGEATWKRFRFLEADIRQVEACKTACQGAEVVLHQAALGSVPRSLARPLETHAVNVGGFLNILWAAREAGCARVVYASSSSVYGDDAGLPKREDCIGNPLSPYAASKLCDEICARSVHHSYGLSTVGLRYFNVFGPRQDPNGPYAAVVPRWLGVLQAGGSPVIYGDGETSRDFCPVANVVQANLLAACAGEAAGGRAFNVALGGRTTLNELLAAIQQAWRQADPAFHPVEPVYESFREGDVRHSQADVSLARTLLGYEPAVSLEEGLRATVDWFRSRSAGATQGC